MCKQSRSNIVPKLVYRQMCRRLGAERPGRLAAKARGGLRVSRWALDRGPKNPPEAEYGRGGHRAPELGF